MTTLACGSGGAGDFAGYWRQTHGSFEGTCLGTLETNGGFVVRFRRPATGDLELVQLDQADLTRELWTTPVVVDGRVATVADSAPSVVNPGETDPITLVAATATVTITFSSDRFEMSGDALLHETFEAVRETGGTSCTFSGSADYQRTLPPPSGSTCHDPGVACTSDKECCAVGSIPGCCSAETKKCIAGVAACTPSPPDPPPDPGLCDGCGGAFCDGRCIGCPGC